MPGDDVRLSLAQASAMARAILPAQGFSDAQAASIVRSMIWAERDECRSHGLYRLPHYVRVAREGHANPAAEPSVHDDSAVITRVDAANGFAPLAFDRGRPALVAKARREGMAVLAIRGCHHISAVWAEVEPLAADDRLAAIAFLPSRSAVAPAGGNKPLFGTDPFAFAWPRQGPTPFVFDFATSAVAKGEIELRNRAGEEIPLGWAIDRDGQPTTNAAAALAGALLPFGGHKGTAMQIMIELLAGAMIGNAFGFEAASGEPGQGATPPHGELVIAFDPDRFRSGFTEDPLARAETLFQRFEQQPGARLPSQRRFAARARTEADGIVLPGRLAEELRALGGQIPG